VQVQAKLASPELFVQSKDAIAAIEGVNGMATP
jgi:hypothetical protein